VSFPVFESKNTLLSILLDDCGGHGRAIETLWTLTKDNSSWERNISGFMRELRQRLSKKYEVALGYTSEEVQSIVWASFSHKLLWSGDQVLGTGKRPDELAAPGLIRYDVEDNDNGSCGYLNVPYIWLWSMAGGDGIISRLPGWNLDDYEDLSAATDPTLPSKCSWENFEKFVARFRYLRSHLLKDGQQTSISEIHHGARLNGDIKFKNHQLSLVVASKQIGTSTSSTNRDEWFIDTCEGRINVREHRHMILNAKNAEGGDAFLSLHTEPPINEIHQYKCYSENTPFTQERHIEERKKAASGEDFFMIFTTKSRLEEIKLPRNCGIVSGDNWKKYFGPFAGRAFIFRNAMNSTGSVTPEEDKTTNKRPSLSVEDVEENVIKRIKSTN
jgi:hypothetical protein